MTPNPQSVQNHSRALQTDFVVEERVFKNIAVGDMGDVIQSVEAHQLDVNIRDAYGNTLLHWAAYRGNLELTNYFIDHGMFLVKLLTQSCQRETFLNTICHQHVFTTVDKSTGLTSKRVLSALAQNNDT